MGECQVGRMTMRPYMVDPFAEQGGFAESGRGGDEQNPVSPA